MVQDIIDAISHQEMKLHDMDDSGESYDPSGGSEILERCDDCYKIRSVFIHFYHFRTDMALSATSGNLDDFPNVANHPKSQFLRMPRFPERISQIRRYTELVNFSNSPIS